MADYTQIYGPFYGGMLGKQAFNTQQNLADTQSLGILSNIMRQMEQNKLLQEQVNIAKLQATREYEKQQRQMQVFDLLKQRMGGLDPASSALAQGASVGDIGPTVTNAQRMQAAPTQTRPSSNMMPADLLQLAALGELPGAATAVQAGTLGQKQFEFGNLSAAQKEDVRIRDAQLALDQQKFMADLTKWAGLSGAERLNVLFKGAELRDKGVITPEQYNAVLAGAQGGPAPQVAQQTVPQAPQVAPQSVPSQGPSMQVAPTVQQRRDDLRMQILQNELATEKAAGNAQNVADLEREIATLQGKRPTSTPQQTSGMSPEQQREVAKKRAEEEPQATYAFRTTSAQLDNLEKVASDLAVSPGLSGITGVMGAIPNIRGSNASNAQAKLEELRGKVSVSVLTAMREASKSGGAVGNVTEREWPRLESVMGNLGQAQNESQLRKTLLEIAAQARASKERLAEAYSTAYPQRREQILPPAGMSAQPRAGQRVIDFGTMR